MPGLKNGRPGLPYVARWIVHKVLSRDPLYVPRRLSYAARKKIVDAAYGRRSMVHGLSFIHTRFDDPGSVAKHFRSRTSPSFHFDASGTPAITAAIGEDHKRRTIGLADEIVAGRVRLHKGHAARELHPGWDDPREKSAGVQWELNRQFFYTTLGFAFRYTGSGTYAARFRELSRSWILRYADSIGRIAWDHPFEVAARLNAYIWGFYLFLPDEEWSPADRLDYLRAVYRLSDYLDKVIEYHNPGNHLILEAKALATSALLFPEFRNSAKRSERAWRHLRREMNKQICRDGVHAERSTMYHAIVAGELAELALLCRRNRQDDHGLAEAVVRMAGFLRHLTSRIDIPPLFGDSYLTDSYYRFWAPAMADLLEGRAADLDPNGLIEPEQTLWTLNGSSGPTGPRPRAAPRPLRSRAFPDGGYFISRWREDDRSVLFWDCGPVGYGANPYHGHVDLLSFQLGFQGTLFFADSGYDERSTRMSGLLRDTPAHNTISLSDKGQAVLAPLNGRFEIWRRPTARLLLWESGESFDLMMGAHDGFLKQKLGCYHQRAICAMKDRYWLVCDFVGGSGAETVRQFFHLAPGMAAAPGGPDSWTLRKSGKTLEFRSLVFGRPDLKTGGARLGRSRMELFPNRLERRPFIGRTVSGRLPVGLCTLVMPSDGAFRQWRVTRDEDRPGEFAAEILVELEGAADRFSFVFGNDAWDRAPGLRLSRTTAGPSPATTILFDSTDGGGRRV